MKKFFAILIPALLIAAFAQAQIETPAASPSCEFKQTVGLTDITVNYSRPGVKDRSIFAADGLVPWGQIWRTGANQATTIEFSKDVMFGDAEVAAGTYALYTIPEKDQWTVMLYSDLSLGGNVEAYDQSKEVARAVVPTNKMNGSVETFAIDIQNIRDASATLDFYWDQTWVAVPLKLHTDKQVMAQIDDFAANPMSSVASNYVNSGWYLYNSGKDSKKAAEYMKKGVEYSDSPFKYFWMNRTAEVMAANGDYKGAVEMAQAAHEVGMNAPENARGFYEGTVKAQLDSNIEMWSKKM